MFIIALIFVLITWFEWADWRKRHDGTSKLWKLVTVNIILLIILEAQHLVRDKYNLELALNGLYRFLGRWL
ncbi:hypothetical protein [Paenibacillus bouchesdurhonensis]|uniref:hypothetical protein n=1 Tax=Paenibacillus bouchesdurhonensis TaxID=1870990 RepID=UPI000DA5F2B4|nr:hypothetical protein [Paenibacillus bouchesdurhonensis]